MMHRLPKIFLLSLFLLLVAGAAIPNDSTAARLQRIKALVKITYEQLIEEGCPIPDFEFRRRNPIQPSRNQVLIELQTKLKERFVDMLIECRSKRLGTKSTLITTQSSTPTLATVSTTTTPANSTVPTPSECVKAINLTEAYRLNYIDLPGSNGDTKKMYQTRLAYTDVL